VHSSAFLRVNYKAFKNVTLQMPSSALKHFILTRFNVRVKEWKTTKNGELVLSEDWLSHRFKLFETYCFPSVRNQTNQDFVWYVFFDTQTPEPYRSKILELHRVYSNFRPLFINDFTELLPVVRAEIRKSLTPENTHVLTSRMDNDDSIHQEYVSEIQKTFKGQSEILVDIIDGYNLSIEPTVKLGKIRSHLNPFSSLIEEANDPKTVLSRSHTDWTKENVLEVKNKRLWLQIIHEKNKVNTYRGIRVASFKKLNTDFGLPASLITSFPPTAPLNVLAENVDTLIHEGIKNLKKIARKIIPR
jgi:hypothetical protein